MPKINLSDPRYGLALLLARSFTALLLVRLFEFPFVIFAPAITRRGQWTPRLFRPTRSRKMPAAPDSNETESKTQDESRGSNEAEGKFQHFASRIVPRALVTRRRRK
jgi:hypothetical protein